MIFSVELLIQATEQPTNPKGPTMSDAKEVTSFEDHPFPWREYHEHHDNTRSVFDSSNKFVGYFPAALSRPVLARLNSYVEQQTRSAELAAECERLKSVIANDTENEESARVLAAEVFGKEWANGDSYGVPNVVNFVERFRDELDAAKAECERLRAQRNDVLSDACDGEWFRFAVARALFGEDGCDGKTEKESLAAISALAARLGEVG